MRIAFLTKRATWLTGLTLSLALAVFGSTPQGKSQKGGSKGNPGKQVPLIQEPSESQAPSTGKAAKTSKARTVSKTRVSKKVPHGSKRRINNPTNIAGTRHSCIQSCNTSHKNDTEFCKGRTGEDRSACERDINERHRACIQACPK